MGEFRRLLAVHPAARRILVSVLAFLALYVGIYELSKKSKVSLELGVKTQPRVVRATYDTTLFVSQNQPSASSWLGLGAFQRRCKLQNNIIESKRQLRDCSYKAVVVTPNPVDSLDGNGNFVGVGNKTFSPRKSKIPLVQCMPLEDISLNKQDFFAASVGATRALDNDLQPPCVRPVYGREAVAYVSFITQNYHQLPDYVFFIHGHDGAWHQDRGIHEIIEEFDLDKLHADIYVSLNDHLQKDFRRCASILGTSCITNTRQAKLERIYSMYFQEYIGHPLPLDLAHFCCAQFLVSRRRIQARPLEMWQSALKYLLEYMPTVPDESGLPCNNTACFTVGIFMEELWPLLMGETAPFPCISTHLSLESITRSNEHRWWFDDPLRTDLLRQYRANASRGLPLVC